MKISLRLILASLSWILLAAPAPMSATLSIAENINAIEAEKGGLSGEFSFIVVGDCRGNDWVYTALLKIAASYKPMFILVTGDMVNSGTSAEFAHYAALIETISIPIVHIPGNHDVIMGKDNYVKSFGALNWSFDYGLYRFIGLDNSTGSFSFNALEFAGKMLQKDKICIVAFHVPPDFDRWKVHAMNEEGFGDRMVSLIEKAKAPYVFLGHIHLYDEIKRNGTKYVISAGGGAPLYGQFGFGRPEYGLVVVHVNASGITHEWIALPGQNGR